MEKTKCNIVVVVVVQSLGCVPLFRTHGIYTPGSSVLYSLPEFAQIYVHWVGDNS